jgi:hypothetical protein
MADHAAAFELLVCSYIAIIAPLAAITGPN